MKRHPLDITGQLVGFGLLGVAAAPAILGVAGSLALNTRANAERAEDARAAVALAATTAHQLGDRDRPWVSLRRAA